MLSAYLIIIGASYELDLSHPLLLLMPSLLAVRADLRMVWSCIIYGFGLPKMTIV